MNKYSSLLSKINGYLLLATARKVHGPYTRKDGRMIVIIVNDDGSKKTVSYPKHLMQEHLGYDLGDLTVDHIDRNHSNNDINNLRVMPRDEHSAADTRRVKLVDINCAMCGNKFSRSPRLIRDKSKKNKAGPFCSRKCAGQYARKLQLGMIDKLPAQPHFKSEYYRNIKSSIRFLIEKYG